MIRFLLTLLLVISFSGQAHALKATDADAVMLTDAAIIPDSEMAEMRGGFFDIGGIIYRFAVDIRTQVDGALDFVRKIEVVNNGKGFDSNTMTALVDGGKGAQVTGNGTALIVPGQNGSTVIMNQNGNGTPSSIIINTADNADITQTVNIDLTLQSSASVLSALSGAAADLTLAMQQLNALQSIGFGF